MEVGEGGRASLAGTRAREGRIAMLTNMKRVDEQIIKDAGVVFTTHNAQFFWDKGQRLEGAVSEAVKRKFSSKQVCITPEFLDKKNEGVFVLFYAE